MQIAFLGLGQMGAAIAHRLVQRRYDVTVWNRTEAATQPLVDAGAEKAESAAHAVSAADIIFTMLFDDAAVEDVLLTQKSLAAMQSSAVHVSLSTISVRLAEQLEAEHTALGQRFISAPVFGRPGVAAEGKLWLVLAGAAAVIVNLHPVLGAFSRGSTVVGTKPSQANAVKLVGNFMISSLIASLSEAFTVAEAQGVAPAVFLEAVNSALFQSAFVSNYGKLMIHPSESPGATIKLGAKDTRLFREVAEAAEVQVPLASLYQEHMAAAIDAGRGDEDWAAGYLAQIRAENGR